MGYISSTFHCLKGEVNDVENNLGPAVFINTNATTTVYAGYASQGNDSSTLLKTLVSSVRCVANYGHLIIVKICNQMEDTVLRICLLDKACKVSQDINSVQKSVFAVNCYNEVN